MDVLARNHVRTLDAGQDAGASEPALTLVMAHGFGCDQNMWRLLIPALRGRYRTVLFDYVGAGRSDLSQYDPERYASLDGYAQDLIEVTNVIRTGPTVLVAHSVSAMIGVVAERQAPGLFAAHVMIGPSPSYLNRPGYVGGFERRDIDDLLAALAANYLGWSRQMAPMVMGAPDQPELAEDLTNSFCRTDPDIAARFARATFLADNLADLPAVTAPVLLLQSTDDLLAPVAVGEYLARALPDATLRLITNTGHCPHLSAPQACAEAIDGFLAQRGLAPAPTIAAG